MAKVYHWHADVGANGDLNCGLVNGHDASCAKGILTNANEDSCEKMSKGFPQGKPHKCYHIVPDNSLVSSEAETEIDIWLATRRPQRRRMRKRPKMKRSVRSKRRK